MRRSVIAMSVLAILGAACGAPSTVTARTVNVEMSEFAYSPSTISLTAGETVTLRLRNSGTVEHEFMAGRHAVIGKGYSEDWLAMAKGDHASGHDMGHQGAGIRIPPRDSTTLTITVPAEAGEYEFGCFVAGHYEGGMKGQLVVR